MPKLYSLIPHEVAYAITRYTTIAGIIVVVGLFIMQFIKPVMAEKKALPRKIFFRLCILALINLSLALFLTFFLSYDSYENFNRFRSFQSEICYCLYSFSWFFLLDYIIKRDPGRIKQNNRRAVLLSLAIVVIRLIMTRIALGADFSSATKEKDYVEWASFPLELLVVLIAGAFMIHGYLRILGYHKERRELTNCRLDFFFLPWLIGVLLQFIICIDIEGLCAAVSLVLLYFGLRNRDKYIDWETGFFNENYIECYEQFTRQYKSLGKAALSISFSDNGEDAMALARRIISQDSFLIRRQDGRFFLVLSTGEKMAVEVTKKNLQDAAHSNVPPVNITIRQFMKTSYENEVEFVKRAFKESEK